MVGGNMFIPTKAVFHIYQSLTFIVVTTIKHSGTIDSSGAQIYFKMQHLGFLNILLESQSWELVRDMMTGGMKLSINCVYCGYQGNWPPLLFTYSATSCYLALFLSDFPFTKKPTTGGPRIRLGLEFTKCKL